jgi:hypothetical protein
MLAITKADELWISFKGMAGKGKDKRRRNII